MLKGITILLSFFILNCSSNSSKEIKTIIVNSFKVPCTGVAPMSCYQIKNSEEDETWSNFYNNIEGFEYSPGFLYTLQVEVETLAESEIPADGSSLKYTLIQVLEKTKDIRLSINDIWVLETINGDAVSKVFPKTPYIEIQVSKAQCLGNDGCNNFTGRIEQLDDSMIEFGLFASTKMACPNDDLSFKFMENLDKTDNYIIGQGTLTFYQGQLELLTFKKID
jgi:heat shock protein HslJ